MTTERRPASPPAPPTSRAGNRPVVRLRVLRGSDVAIGPGKADLLEAIVRTGSIAAAGRTMKMSYRRAWLLVDMMNRSFREPVVEAAKGGPHGGGARVTALGLEVLAAYRALETQAAATFGELFAAPPSP